MTLVRAYGFGYGASMLSVVIETCNYEDALARTLASLVGGAVDGLVREVIVCDAGSSDRTHDVAEHAGCLYLAGVKAGAGIGRARGEWLLLLEPGARLLDGWIEGASAHMAGEGAPARFRPTRQPLLRRFLGRWRPLANGLIITKRQALSLAGADGSAEAIARSARARRLSARILVASG